MRDADTCCRQIWERKELEGERWAGVLRRMQQARKKGEDPRRLLAGGMAGPLPDFDVVQPCDEIEL